MGVTEEFAKYRVARELKVAELKAAMAAELEAWAEAGAVADLREALHEAADAGVPVNELRRVTRCYSDAAKWREIWGDRVVRQGRPKKRERKLVEYLPKLPGLTNGDTTGVLYGVYRPGELNPVLVVQGYQDSEGVWRHTSARQAANVRDYLGELPFEEAMEQYGSESMTPGGGLRPELLAENYNREEYYAEEH